MSYIEDPNCAREWFQEWVDEPLVWLSSDPVLIGFTANELVNIDNGQRIPIKVGTIKIKDGMLTSGSQEARELWKSRPQEINFENSEGRYTFTDKYADQRWVISPLHMTDHFKHQGFEWIVTVFKADQLEHLGEDGASFLKKLLCKRCNILAISDRTEQLFTLELWMRKLTPYSHTNTSLKSPPYTSRLIGYDRDLNENGISTFWQRRCPSVSLQLAFNPQSALCASTVLRQQLPQSYQGAFDVLIWKQTSELIIFALDDPNSALCKLVTIKGREADFNINEVKAWENRWRHYSIPEVQMDDPVPTRSTSHALNQLIESAQTDENEEDEQSQNHNHAKSTEELVVQEPTQENRAIESEHLSPMEESTPESKQQSSDPPPIQGNDLQSKGWHLNPKTQLQSDLDRIHSASNEQEDHQDEHVHAAYDDLDSISDLEDINDLLNQPLEDDSISGLPTQQLTPKVEFNSDAEQDLNPNDTQEVADDSLQLSLSEMDLSEEKKNSSEDFASLLSNQKTVIDEVPEIERSLSAVPQVLKVNPDPVDEPQVVEETRKLSFSQFHQLSEQEYGHIPNSALSNSPMPPAISAMSGSIAGASVISSAKPDIHLEETLPNKNNQKSFIHQDVETKVVEVTNPQSTDPEKTRIHNRETVSREVAQSVTTVDSVQSPMEKQQEAVTRQTSFSQFQQIVSKSDDIEETRKIRVAIDKKQERFPANRSYSDVLKNLISNPKK